LRPAFADWFRHEVQVIATVLQVDFASPYDVHCITGASAALMLGGVPFAGPIAGVRLAHIAGRWLTNPTFEDLASATIELVVAGRVNGDDVDILMVEAGGFEHTMGLIARGAPRPDEHVLSAGLEAAKDPIRLLCGMQEALVGMCEVPDRTWLETLDYQPDAYELVERLVRSELESALAVVPKLERNRAVDAARTAVLAAARPEWADRSPELVNAFRSLEKRIVRARVIDRGVRVDGRAPDDIRPLGSRVGLLNRVHGSGLFQRGETQVLAVATLDMPRKGRLLDTVAPLDTPFPDELKRYMHNYRMPPFSVGETGRLGGPRRREIGHGALAEKAVLPVLPSEDEFPYAIRVVSEVLESNGSTSMASACASTLALMDAGVPLKGIVGGIAMGLIAEGESYVTLTDILGAEDNYGDMDFKVAGTEDVVTALQLDTKTIGIPSAVLVRALEQARRARLRVIAAMRDAISIPRAEMSPFAPRILVETIPVDKIGQLIGPKGKNINDIAARTGAQIDIEDDGRVFIAATDGHSAEDALELVRAIAKPRVLEVGEEFDGTVVKTTDFGAFVSLLPGTDGLVHISKLGRGERVKSVESVVKVGDRIRVRISEIRPDGKLSLVPSETTSD
jgi:polyribonucleotide nucleotidyltransferase